MSEQTQQHTPRTVPSGWLAGHAIRKARKAGRCQYGGQCRNRIEVGSYYVEGELNMEAGGYGADRYCLDCVPEARAAIAKAGAA